MSTIESEDRSREKPKVDLDQLLVEEIGTFGKFQMKVIGQCLFAVLFLSWNINEFVFTAARTESRCLIPECEDPGQTEFAPSWVSQAVPSSGGSVDNCQRFGTISNVSEPWASNSTTCPASLFDTSVLKQCEEYLYENTNTVVYAFGLACDEWRRAMIGSVRILGMMVALALTGYVSDRWGRRRALAINACASAAVGIARYWAPGYHVYVLILFLESVIGCGSFTCAYVMMVELLGPKHRVTGGAIINSTFTIGQITLGLIAWAVNGWRNLLLALYIPQFLCIFYFWTLTESVRWLMSKGRFEEAEDLLKKAALGNGKELSQKSLEDLQANAEEERRKNEEDKPPLVLVILKNKKFSTRCFVACIWWITGTFVYYGMTINAVNLTGNLYLNYVVVTAVELPGFWAVVLVVDRVGRKPIIITTFWLCAACQFTFILIPNDLTAVSLVVYLLGKLAISMVATSANIATLELFPTECRHRLYAFASMVGRVGSIVAPLTPALGITLFAELPFILFGGMALLAGALTFLVPETLGVKLPDTMEEVLTITPGENKVISTKL